MKLKNMKKHKKNKKTRTVKDHADAHVETPTEPKKGRTSAVNYDEFVKVWTGSSSVLAVAEAMNINKNSATAIAGRLRKAGVHLQMFARRFAQPIDVKRLNKIVTGKAD